MLQPRLRPGPAPAPRFGWRNTRRRSSWTPQIAPPQPAAGTRSPRPRLEAWPSPSRPSARCGANCATRCAGTTAAGGSSSRSTASTARARPCSRTGSPRSSPRTGRPSSARRSTASTGPRSERYARGRTEPRGLLPRLVRLRDVPARAHRALPRGRADRRDDGLPARGVRPRAGCAGRVRVGGGAPGCRAHRRRDLPAPPGAARPVGLVGVARRPVRGRPTRAWPCATAATPTRTRRSNARYREGQQLYLDEADPRGAASAIVDNTDLAHPRRVSEDVR